MPAPLNIIGQRFGKLLVISPAGTVQYGRAERAWACRCDCGAEIIVPQKRLTTTQERGRINACPACRSIPCAVCGIPVFPIANTKTCSTACRAEMGRSYLRAYYHKRRASDEGPALKRQAVEREKKRREALPPSEKQAVDHTRYLQRIEREGLAAMNAAGREYYAKRVSNDPEFLEKRRAIYTKKSETEPDFMKTRREYSRKAKKTKIAVEMSKFIEGTKNGNSND